MYLWRLDLDRRISIQIVVPHWSRGGGSSGHQNRSLNPLEVN